MKICLKLTQSTRYSASMKLLAQALTQRLGYKVFRTTGDMLRKRSINYGQGQNKIAQYRWFEANGIPALEFTTDRNTAFGWWESGECVIGRRLIQASCGKGIVVYKPDDDNFDYESSWCPVYTKYKKKKREFRVHVFKDKVVCIVEKKQRSDWTGPRDTHIRNLANGYVFCQNPTNLPEGLEELAIKASKVVSSDFKGVDIGYNERKNELFTIEVNSAPGIQGSNLQAYVNAIVSSI